MKKALKITVSLILVAILLVMAMPLYALEEVSVEEIEDSSVLNNYTICDGCKSLILENLGQYNQ